MSELPMHLPKWPDIDPEQRGKSFRQQVTEWNEVTGAMNRYYNNECCYFADDADALIAALSARLRVAVEALAAVKSFDPGDFRPLKDEIKIHQLAAKALVLIGPLPDAPEGA